MSQQSNSEDLKKAFEHFNQLSGDLIVSYKNLEQQVSSLTEQLELAKQQQADEVHSRQQLSEKYIDLLRLLPAGVIVLDKWGEVVEANPFAQELLEIDLLGRKWLEVINACFAPKNDDGHEVSLTNGKRITVETRALVSQPGQILLLIDQTATRKLQQKLSQNERLTAIGQMSSALAHQIRTPLSAALLHAANLRDMPLNAEQSKRFATKVCDNLQDLESQVRDMLVFSKANIALEDRVNLKALLDHVLQAMSSKFEKARVILRASFTIDGKQISSKSGGSAASGVILLCNRAIFIGAINNLLANALDASSIGKTVLLSLELNGSNLDICVTDNGIGMNAVFLERINAGEAFLTSKAQGTGLGLAVVRAVVAAHKGRFSVESQLGIGTRISIQSITVQRSGMHSTSAEQSLETPAPELDRV